MRRQSKIPLRPRPSFEAKAKAEDRIVEAKAKAKARTVEAKAKAKDTKFCPRGSSRPRPGLEDYIIELCYQAHQWC